MTEEQIRYMTKGPEKKQAVSIKKGVLIQYNGMLSADEREQMRTAMKQDMDQYEFIVIDNRYTLYEVEKGE